MPHRAQIAVILGTLLCWVMTANLESAEPKKKRREIAVTAAEAPAEPALTEVKPEDLSAEAIEAKLKQLESATNLDPVVKKSLVDTYTEALNHLKAAQEHAQREAGFRKATIEAPRELQRVKARLDAHRDDPSVPATTDMGLSELQEALDTAEAKYEALQKRLDDLQEEPNRRAERRKEIPELQREAQRLVEELEAQIEPVRASTETARDPVTAAENLRKIAQREALERELRVYEEELRNYETTSDLIEAKRDHAVMQVELAEKEMKAWREALNERRRIDADRESKAAIEAAKNASPALRRLAEENATLAAERQELVAKIEIAYKEVDALQEQVEVLDTLYRKIRTRVDRIGLTESIGVLLRKQRESLPNIAEHIRYIEERKADMAKLNLQQVELEDKRAELAEIDERIEKILAETHTNRKSRKGPSETEIRTILLASREYLDAQIKDMNTYEDVLEKLNNTEADLVRKATDFSVFIREYILWIKSSNPPGLDDAREFGTACGWLLSPTHWGAVASRLNSDLRNHSTKYLGLIALLVALGYSQRVWRKLLRTAGRDAADHHTTSVLSTCVAFFSTFMLSVISPGLMWLIGWRLGQTAGRNEFVIAMAHGLQGGAFFLATINLTRHMCRSLGLGESHFGWPKGPLDAIRKSMWWLTVVGLPLTLIVLVTESQPDEAIKNSVGRTAFLGLQALFIACAHAVWHAPQGLSKQLTLEKMSGRVDHWWLRLCRLCQVASFAVPGLLAVLALVGYYYTAVQLAQRVLATSWLIGGAFVLHATLLRWLLLAYRDLARKRTREIRAAEDRSRAPNERRGEFSLAEPTVRLADINVQMHKLVGMLVCAAFLFGCSVVWVELYPALEILDTVQLWPHPFSITEKPDATATADLTTVAYTLSLGQLLAATVVGLITAFAAKNVPGLIEISILRNLNLDSGARYAISAVTQYAISACGISLAFGCVGVGWQNVQWLVAAMTVGLGFGLQEIFANFASGLLLLIERPIRVGDLVTIGDTTGKVTRIRIRATTITDSDMREAIVPNRNIISGKVMNWTLTDSTTRMTFTVTIPNTCAPDLVQQVLLDVAKAHPHVLKDPAPHALLDEFAIDKLTFVCHVYLANRDVYNQLRHDLNSAIRAAFIREGIDKSHQEDEPQIIIHLPEAA